MAAACPPSSATAEWSLLRSQQQEILAASCRQRGLETLAPLSPPAQLEGGQLAFLKSVLDGSSPSSAAAGAAAAGSGPLRLPPTSSLPAFLQKAALAAGVLAGEVSAALSKVPAPVESSPYLQGPHAVTDLRRAAELKSRVQECIPDEALQRLVLAHLQLWEEKLLPLMRSKELSSSFPLGWVHCSLAASAPQAAKGGQMCIPHWSSHSFTFRCVEAVAALAELLLAVPEAAGLDGLLQATCIFLRSFSSRTGGGTSSLSLSVAEVDALPALLCTQLAVQLVLLQGQGHVAAAEEATAGGAAAVPEGPFVAATASSSATRALQLLSPLVLFPAVGVDGANAEQLVVQCRLRVAAGVVEPAAVELLTAYAAGELSTVDAATAAATARDILSFKQPSYNPFLRGLSPAQRESSELAALALQWLGRTGDFHEVVREPEVTGEEAEGRAKVEAEREAAISATGIAAVGRRKVVEQSEQGAGAKGSESSAGMPVKESREAPAAGGAAGGAAAAVDAGSLSVLASFSFDPPSPTAPAALAAFPLPGTAAAAAASASASAYQYVPLWQQAPVVYDFSLPQTQKESRSKEELQAEEEEKEAMCLKGSAQDFYSTDSSCELAAIALQLLQQQERGQEKQQSSGKAARAGSSLYWREVSEHQQLHLSRLGWGRYAENRTIYTSEHFTGGGAADASATSASSTTSASTSSASEPRTFHMGVDIEAAVGTAVSLPLAGRIHSIGRNMAELDYGPTIIVEHRLRVTERVTERVGGSAGGGAAAPAVDPFKALFGPAAGEEKDDSSSLLRGLSLSTAGAGSSSSSNSSSMGLFAPSSSTPSSSLKSHEIVFFSLYGHLSLSSILTAEGSLRWMPGQSLPAGTVLGWIGHSYVNGGWPPHLHFQLNTELQHGGWRGDYPGVCTATDFLSRGIYSQLCPDPNIVLQCPWLQPIGWQPHKPLERTLVEVQVL